MTRVFKVGDKVFTMKDLSNWSGLSYSAVRKRFSRGLDDKSVILPILVSSLIQDDPMLAAEYLAMKKESKGTTNNVCILWKKLVSGVTGKPHPMLSKVQSNQIMNFVKAITTKYDPPLPGYMTPQLVMTWAVENWGKFAVRANSDKGLTSYPKTPKIGFLLVHYDIAVQLIAEEQEHKESVSKGKEKTVVLYFGNKHNQKEPEKVAPVTSEADTPPTLSFKEKYLAQFEK